MEALEQYKDEFGRDIIYSGTPLEHQVAELTKMVAYLRVRAKQDSERITHLEDVVSRLERK